MPPNNKNPTGEIVKDWTEFGHHFQIEKLLKPWQKGASERNYRLWENGNPSLGGQYHYTIENAEARAEYVLRCDYAGRISWLERRVQTLESEIALTKKGP